MIAMVAWGVQLEAEGCFENRVRHQDHAPVRAFPHEQVLLAHGKMAMLVEVEDMQPLQVGHHQARNVQDDQYHGHEREVRTLIGEQYRHLCQAPILRDIQRSEQLVGCLPQPFPLLEGEILHMPLAASIAFSAPVQAAWGPERVGQFPPERSRPSLLRNLFGTCVCAFDTTTNGDPLLRRSPSALWA